MIEYKYADTTSEVVFILEGGVVIGSKLASVLDEAIEVLSYEAVPLTEEEEVHAAKALGFSYNGVQVPVLNEDAIGAMQLDLAFSRFNVPAGVFYLSNGIKLPLTIEEWPAFSAQFFATRASFFQV